MRIVQLLPSLSVGGAERLAALLSRSLQGLGHKVAVVSLYDSADSWIEAELRAAGIPIHFLGKRRGLDPRMVPRLARTLRALRPTIVHTHLHTLKYAWLARQVGRRAFGPASYAVVHTLHNLAEHEAEPASRVLQHVAFRTGVEPVAIGDAVAESVRRVYGIAPRHTIPNGIPVADYRAPAGAREELRAALGIPTHAPTFLTVGRLTAQKDHATLLTAFAAPRLHALDARLLVAGEGELRPALERQARALGLLDRVQFLGPRADIPRLLAASDVFVLASRWEGNPLVVMEAMAAGLPIVATSVGSVPELVSPATGRLVTPGDDPGLAEAMSLLAADLPLARALGSNGTAVAMRRFDTAIMARGYAQLYASLMPAAEVA